MITYLKTLLPFRWFVLLLFTTPLLVLGMYMTEVWNYYIYTLIVIITTFILDLTIGLGRRIDNYLLNGLGIIWLFFLIYLIYLSSKSFITII